MNLKKLDECKALKEGTFISEEIDIKGEMEYLKKVICDNYMRQLEIIKS
jgi:hypothetical protein